MNIEEREQELWSDDALIAERVVQFFDLLRSLRSAACSGVDPTDLVNSIKKIDPEMLDYCFHWLMIMLTVRFLGEKTKLDKMKNLNWKEKMSADNIRAAVADCDNNKPSVKAVAQKLGVREDSLSKKLREHPDRDWR